MLAESLHAPHTRLMQDGYFLSMLLYRQVSLGLIVFVFSAVSAVATSSRGDVDEMRLLTVKTICIPVEGCITASFINVYAILQSTNLLERIQQAYEAQLPHGEKPEFTVQSEGTGRYFYVNKDNERCDIRELWRATDTTTTFQCSFYVKGKRSFGTFESLIQIHVKRASSVPVETLWYATDIRIRPQCALVRFFFRNLPGIEYYFRKKAAEMKTIISSVILDLASVKEA